MFVMRVVEARVRIHRPPRHEAHGTFGLETLIHRAAAVKIERCAGDALSGDSVGKVDVIGISRKGEPVGLPRATDLVIPGFLRAGVWRRRSLQDTKWRGEKSFCDLGEADTPPREGVPGL